MTSHLSKFQTLFLKRGFLNFVNPNPPPRGALPSRSDEAWGERRSALPFDTGSPGAYCLGFEEFEEGRLPFSRRLAIHLPRSLRSQDIPG